MNVGMYHNCAHCDRSYPEDKLRNIRRAGTSEIVKICDLCIKKLLTKSRPIDE